MTRENAFLSDKQISNLKEKLLSEKERISNKAYELNPVHLSKDELFDPLDEASANVMATQELRFRNRENFLLKKINEALDRLAKDTYGLCEECDGQISYERLMARPTAEKCITCKEEAEMAESHNANERRPKSLGRALHEVIR